MNSTSLFIASETSGKTDSGRMIREVHWLTAANSLDFFSGGFREVIIPLYLYASGLSAVEVGLFYTINYVVALVLRTPSAMIADATGKKRMIVLGMLTFGLGGLILAFPVSLPSAYAAATVSGLSNGLISSSISSTIAEKAPTPAHRDRLYAGMTSATTLGMAMGALVSALPSKLSQAGLTSMATGFRLLFLLQFILALVAASTVTLKLGDDSKQGLEANLRSAFRLPRSSLPAVSRLSVQSLVGLGAGMALPLLPLWLTLRFHASLVSIALLYFIMRVALAGSVNLAPRLSKVTGPLFFISSAQLISGVLLIAIPFAPTLLVASVVLVARSVSGNLNDPIFRSFIAGVVNPKERTVAFNFVQTIDSIPRAAGPYLGGEFIGLGELSIPFFAAGALYCTFSGVFYGLFRRWKPKYGTEP
ncbi:MAG: MFS transporter [Candidatus Marsarchaeota archaeon]|nr:MFS transporter [Candidatus Marsarchaeota archaeon]